MPPHKITIDSTQHKIQSVCLFQSYRAEVKKAFDIELVANDNEVIIKNLPNTIDPDSIRVDGTGNATILDVVYQPYSSDEEGEVPQESPGSLDTPLSPKPRVGDPVFKALEANHSALLSEKTILADHLKILGTYGKTMRATQVGTTLKDLEGFLDFHLERSKSIHARIVQIDEKVEAAEEKLSAYRNTVSGSEVQEARAKVKVTLSAEQKTKAQLMLTYVVLGASWVPSYDLRAKLSGYDEPQLTLHYRASISQTTGEDWDDVTLTLSTASMTSSIDIPELFPHKIGQRPPPVLLSQDFHSSAPFIPAPPMMIMQHSEPPPLTTYVPQGLLAATALVGHSSVVATFQVQGVANIPSGATGGAHNVLIAELGLKGKLEWVTVPKKQAATFLRCIVKNDSEYTLISGSTSVFLDGNFVCKSSIGDVSPQETFVASLGIDPAVRISYHNLQKFKTAVGSVFAAKADSTLFTQRITIKNTRPTTVYPLFIKDQIPVSETSVFKVNLVEPKELGNAKEKKEVQVTRDVRARRSFKGQGNEIEEVTSREKAGGLGKKAIIPSGTSDVAEDGVIEWICKAEPGKTLDNLDLGGDWPSR